jgi:two-component system, chemotaxis family, response regulator Rcp1
LAKELPHVNDRVIDILLVEDNLGDVLLTQEALAQANVSHTLTVVNDGMDALDFLFRRGRFLQAARPDLVLLDLNLPRKSGREVIGEIEADSGLKDMPLIILTSSRQEQDVLDGYDSKRCLYLVKPSTFSAFVGMIKQMERFWLSVVMPKPARN